ncbi:MAG: GIY-YIG nuclease family protein [Candidatus Gastranaerophilaceae bacterium]
MEKKYYTYVILTKDNTLYCGYTDDVEKRFEMHLSGKGAKYTRSHKPLKIVYTACFGTKIEAQREECRIKGMTRQQKRNYLGV